MSNWERVVERYPALRGKATGMVRCPCHDDRVTSLSVKRTDDGDVLTHCFGGCDWRAVREALGLARKEREDWRDLGVAPNAGPRRHSDAPRIVAEYRYRDLAGDVLAIKERWEPKTFRWRVLWPNGTWHTKFPPNASQAGLPLYNLPVAVALAKRGATVFIVEGEKDADTLASLDLAAVSNPEGASNSVSAYDVTRYLSTFPPNTTWCVLPDNDAPGMAHAERLARALSGHYVTRVLALPELPPKGDVTDYVTRQRAAGAADTEIADTLRYMAHHAPAAYPDDAPNAPPGETAPDFDAWCERAAIVEYDGGRDRATAEREATRERAGVLASLSVHERLALETTDPVLAEIYREMARLEAVG